MHKLEIHPSYGTQPIVEPWPPNKVKIMRFIEVNKHLWSLKATITLLPTFITELKAKFLLQGSENKIIICVISGFLRDVDYICSLLGY